MKIYNQNALIDKINQYLKFKNRPLHLKHGYCHGITLLWLYKMSEGQEAWFYHLINKIVDCKSHEDFENNELDIEKFISHIQWLQNSDDYQIDIHQLDIDKLLERPREFSLSCLFDKVALEKTLREVISDRKMVCLSSHNHTIGVFKRGKHYYVFNSNYDEGKPKIITDSNLLRDEIIECFYKNIKTHTVKLPLEINIASNSQTHTQERSVDKMQIYQELVNKDNIDESGYKNITNLYLACENGDAEEVALLLKKGANPNQNCYHGWTPLLKASKINHPEVVSILLSHGAKPNLSDEQGNTPLLYAVQNKDEKTIDLLLRSGADPLLPKIDGYTPLRAAIKSSDWNSVIKQLLHIKHRKIALPEKLELEHHKSEIRKAGKKMLSQFTNQEKVAFAKMMRTIFTSDLNNSLFSSKPSTQKAKVNQHYQPYSLRYRKG